MARHRSEVEDHGHELLRIGVRFAEQRDNAVFGVAAIDPLEAVGVRVQLVQRFHIAIGSIEVLNPALQLGMWKVIENPPVQAGVVIPFAPLPNLPAHEQQLLAGLRVHVREKQAQIGKLLPVVARHLADERSLPVDHLIVRQRQHEILREGVHHAEGQVVVMELAVDRFF